jgi:hypothetical protein
MRFKPQQRAYAFLTVYQAPCTEFTCCTACRYCSKECQVADWPNHKATCKRMKLKSS